MADVRSGTTACNPNVANFDGLVYLWKTKLATSVMVVPPLLLVDDVADGVAKHDSWQIDLPKWQSIAKNYENKLMQKQKLLKKEKEELPAWSLSQSEQHEIVVRTRWMWAARASCLELKFINCAWQTSRNLVIWVRCTLLCAFSDSVCSALKNSVINKNKRPVWWASSML